MFRESMRKLRDRNSYSLADISGQELICSCVIQTDIYITTYTLGIS